MATIYYDPPDGERCVLKCLIGTEEWEAWLQQNESFRYEGKTGFRCNKRKNGKWYATKKIWASNGGKTVSFYLGQTCTGEKLSEIDGWFSMPEGEFWRWYYNERESGRQDKKKDKGYTAQQCSTSELEQLRAELEATKIELRAAKETEQNPSKLEAAELLNKLRAKNKRSKASLRDVEMILDLLVDILSDVNDGDSSPRHTQSMVAEWG